MTPRRTMSTSAQTLNDALAETKAKAPPDVVATISAANAELDAKGAAPGIPVGERAPDFELPDAVGGRVRLSDRLSKGAVVVTFYRGEWCPYCNVTIHKLQEALPSIKAQGASLIAISPQRPDDALTMTEKHGLEFDVLSDIDQQTIRAYDVQFRVPAEVEDVHLNVFKKDISELNADGTWNLPVPATFVIDTLGVVRARHVGADYMRRMEPDDIVAALAALGEGGA
jgi:peroxiredoxin